MTARNGITKYYFRVVPLLIADTARPKTLPLYFLTP
jgi:hypothetical protein